MAKPFEIVPIVIAGGIAAFVLYSLISFFDATNTKVPSYLWFGFLAGAGAQIGVRLAGVS